MDKEILYVVSGICLFLGLVIGSLTFAAHISALDLQACFEVVKDKTAVEMNLLCRGSH